MRSAAHPTSLRSATLPEVGRETGPVDIDGPVRDTSRAKPGSIMSHAELAKIIDDAFERRNDVGPATKGPVREAVEHALDLLDRGAVRVAEKRGNGVWQVNQWLKKAVLLSFRLTDMNIMPFGAEAGARWAFGKSAHDLTTREAAELAAILPNPVRRSARAPNSIVRRLAGLYEHRAEAHPALDACVHPRAP